MEKEPQIRLIFFFGVLALMMLWEVIAPFRNLRIAKSKRWLSNLGLVVLNTIVLRAIFPLAAVGMATLTTENSWGLFNMLSLSELQVIVLSVVLLDFIIYLQHVLFHALPTFWRLHKVHHTDLDFDVTTGLRFHPLEILLSMGIKMIAIALLGVPVIAVIIFEVVLNATSMFNHGNVSLPKTIDRFLRLFMVTPDMHRVHHSIITHETDSNFGFNLPWWDYILGTYRSYTSLSQKDMPIGLSEYQKNLRVEQLPYMLIIPFLKKPLHENKN